VVAFLLLNGGAVLAALLVAYAAGARVRTSLFALCTLCASLVLVHSAVLATGLIAGLTVGGLTTFVTIVLGGAWLLVRRANRGDEPRKSAVPAAPATLFAPLLAVTAGCLYASRWVVPHDDLAAGAATVPMAWVAGAVLAWAVCRGRRLGAVVR